VLPKQNRSGKDISETKSQEELDAKVRLVKVCARNTLSRRCFVRVPTTSQMYSVLDRKKDSSTETLSSQIKSEGKNGRSDNRRHTAVD